MTTSKINFDRILFVSNSGSIGGAQQCLLDIILRLPNNIVPVVLVPIDGPFANLLKENNIPFYIVNFRGWWYSKFRIKLIERALNNLIALIRSYKLLKHLNISIVYSNTLYSPFGAILAKFFHVPHIWHIHEFPHLNKIQKFDFGLNFSMRFVNKYSDAIICPSIALKKELSLHIPSIKIHNIYNGVDNNRLLFKYPEFQKHENKNDLITITIIGSIINFKGQSDAITAISRLINKGINARLLILGDGDEEYKKLLKSQSKELGVENSIVWLGFQKNVYDFVANSDLLFVCSKFESFGMVIIEAMSIGCPVIATHTGGIPEIITHGFNGLLYEVGNVEDLVKKSLLLLNDKHLYSEISKNSRITTLKYFDVKNYSNDIINKIYYYINYKKQIL